MKQILNIPMMVLLLLAAGCQRSSVEGIPGESVTAAFRVSLPSDMPTKAISNGAGATELLFKAYDASGRHLEELDQKVAVSGGQASFTARFNMGMDYKLVFWAQTPGKYAFTEDADGKPVVELLPTVLPEMLNDDSYDAFYAVQDLVNPMQDFEMTVTLTRPFAQLNIATGAEDFACMQEDMVYPSSFVASVTVTDVPNVLNLLTGEVSGAEEVAYTSTQDLGDEIVFGQKSYNRLAMVYILASPDGSVHQVQADLSVDGPGKTYFYRFPVPNVPFKRNYCTHLLGDSIFTVGGTLTVDMSASFGTPDNTVDTYSYAGDGTASHPFSVADFRHLVMTQGQEGQTFEFGATCYLKGIVSLIYSNGNFNDYYTGFCLLNEGSPQWSSQYVLVSPCAYYEGRTWTPGDPLLQVDDEVIVTCSKAYYPSVLGIGPADARLYSLNGKTSPD